MKAMHQFFAGIALAIPLLGVGVAWGGSSVVGGNVIVDRPFVDSFEEFYMVDTNHPINVDGKLDYWEIYAGANTPVEPVPSVQLVIYRQKGGNFFIVNRSDLMSPVPGYNRFLLNNPNDQIKVKAGDFVGAYFSEPGLIVFNYDPPSPPDFSAFDPNDPMSNLMGTTLFLIDPPSLDFNNLDLIPLNWSSNRHYSIRVGSWQLNIAGIKAQPNILWPPNHKMVPVTVSAMVSEDYDDEEPSCKITSVSSNEPENGLGDGDTAPDWEITGDLTLNLRAERAGNGDGRVYTLTVQCTDWAGDIAPDVTVTVTVPHDQGK